MKVRKFASVLLVLLLLLSLTACGGSAKSEAMDMNAEAEFAPGVLADGRSEAPMETVASAELKTESGSTTALPTDRKLIRTISIEAETEDLSALLESLTARIAQLEGYVEAKNLRNGSSYGGYIRRHLSLTVRIPADRADEFVNQVSENSNIVSSTETVDDVTLQYVDTESQIKALETEQERLIELLAQAEKLEDILKIQDRLTDVRYELERYASYLRTLENKVSYATVHLTITEVKEYTPVMAEEPTMWQRITEGFARSLRDIGDGVKELCIWIAVNSPYLLIWGVVIACILLFIRKHRVKKHRPVPPPENPE